MEDAKMRSEEHLAEQAERCRRIARQTVDDELRHSFEKLAREYEERLGSRPNRFMLKREKEKGER